MRTLRNKSVSERKRFQEYNSNKINKISKRMNRRMTHQSNNKNKTNPLNSKRFMLTPF